MKRMLIVGAVIALAGCNQVPPDAVEAEPATEANLTASDGPDDQVAACARRGVAYYKEIGSYPTLSSAPNKGRSAEDVALERCRRTTTAF